MVCQSNVARSLRPWPRFLLSCAAPAKATRLTSQGFSAIFERSFSFPGADLQRLADRPLSFSRLGHTTENEPKLFHFFFSSNFSRKRLIEGFNHGGVCLLLTHFRSPLIC